MWHHNGEQIYSVLLKAIDSFYMYYKVSEGKSPSGGEL